MTILTAIKKKIEYKAMLMHYDLLKAEIDELHEDIDNFSVRLGECIKLKHEIESLINSQEKKNELFRNSI